MKPKHLVPIICTALCAAGCDPAKGDRCHTYCTVTLDHCGPASPPEVDDCSEACRADMADKSSLCADAFDAYTQCLYDADGCEWPECESLYETWSHECYATGDLAGPFELVIDVESTVTGEWVPGDPADLLTCTYPITATALRGGIARWDAVDWNQHAVSGGNYCGGGLTVNTGLIDFWGSDIIKAGTSLTAVVERSCNEPFETVWRFDFADPDGVVQSVDATVTCLAP